MQVIRLTTTEVKEEDRLGEINVLRFSKDQELLLTLAEEQQNQLQRVVLCFLSMLSL